MTNARTLKETLTQTGFVTAGSTQNGPERLTVFVRPDGVYAHVRVDNSKERPSVLEVLAVSEREDFMGTVDPSIQFLRYPDGVSRVWTAYPARVSITPAQLIERYAAAIEHSTPVAPWKHLGDRCAGSSVDRGVVANLPSQHRTMLGYKEPRWYERGILAFGGKS